MKVMIGYLFVDAKWVNKDPVICVNGYEIVKPSLPRARSPHRMQS